MKIRNGFVSNSSTSSFLIAYKRVGVCPTCGRSSDFIATIDNDENSIISLMNSAEAKGYIRTEMSYFDDDGEQEYGELRKTLIHVEDLKAEGYEFAIIELSHHNEYLRKLMDEAVSNSSVVILYTYE